MVLVLQFYFYLCYLISEVCELFIVMDYKKDSERTPVLGDRASVVDWKRKFIDYCTGKRFWNIFNRTELAPELLTHEELQAVPAASRYAAKHDAERKLENFQNRSEEAFATLCKAMEKDSLIYGCAALDTLREQSPRDPAAAYTLVMDMLQPSHVDAQMTVDALISALAISDGETAPALIQRLAEYVQRLPVANRPNDVTLMKHIKRAMKRNMTIWEKFKYSVETMMGREPPITYAAFCQGMMRKHDEIQEEAAQEAALNTEATQSGHHAANEDESAMYTQGRGGGKGGRHGGRGRGRGRGRTMGRGYEDARIGALYYAQGGKGYDDLDHKRPFYRGGGRQDGGRGYDFDQNYGKGGRGRGGGKGKSGGKGSQQYKPKFEGTCNKCGNYGHKEVDCYAKRSKY